MPANYTHYRFGREVLNRLTPLRFLQARHCRQAFLTGLHGPDLLFFHKPIKRDAVCRHGYAMHQEPARAFFEHGVKYVRVSHDKVALSYLLGFVCHFTLDSACHRYIGEYEAHTGVSHARIEAELDRYYMLRYGENPSLCNSAAHILPSRTLAESIAPLFKLPASDLLESMRSIRFYSGLLVASNPAKRALLSAVTALPPLRHYVGDMILQKEPDQRCQEAVAWLSSRTEESVATACRLIYSVLRAVQTSSSLPKDFDRNYE